MLVGLVVQQAVGQGGDRGVAAAARISYTALALWLATKTLPLPSTATPSGRTEAEAAAQRLLDAAVADAAEQMSFTA